MGLGGALREVALVLDECETGRVSRVELIEEPDSAPDGGVTANVDLTLATHRSEAGEPAVSLRTTSVDADGKLQFALETVDAVVPTTRHAVSLEPSHATFDPDGTVTVTLSASVPTDRVPGDAGVDDGEPGPAAGPVESAPVIDEDSAETTPVTDEADGSTVSRRDRDVPPFRDPELLAEVYDSCDTFDEMPEALGMDVTAETVRRYMIDFGIHEPRSYRTSRGDADEESADAEDDLQSPVALADGIGLPEDVTIDAIVETVKTSNTLYEVERDIGFEREDALEMLQELDLLELVVGRLATEAEREVSREEVIERLRQRAGAG